MNVREFVRQNEKMNSSLITDWDKEMLLEAIQIYADQQLRLYGVSKRFSPKESTNVLRKPKLALISTDLKNILVEGNGYHYNNKEDIEFINKYAGKKVLVYEWANDCGYAKMIITHYLKNVLSLWTKCLLTYWYMNSKNTDK